MPSKYGDEAYNGLKAYGSDFMELWNSYADEFMDDYLKYSDDAVDAYLKHGDGEVLEETPNRLKEVWVEGDYKYTVRVHEGNSKYTDADSIYRVSRQSTILDEHGQGTGLEHLGTDGNWYHESVLTEFFKGGTPNPNFNEAAARMTHIPISGGN